MLYRTASAPERVSSAGRTPTAKPQRQPSRGSATIQTPAAAASPTPATLDAQILRFRYVLGVLSFTLSYLLLRMAMLTPLA